MYRPLPATVPSMTSERRKFTIQTPQKLTPELCRTLISSAPVFRASPTVSVENAGDSRTPGEPCSLKLPDWLKPNDLRFYVLKMFPDCFRMTKAGHFTPSSPRFMSWGMVWNGLCVTAPISTSPSPGAGCSLSDILIPDAPEKYFLSAEMTEKLLFNSSAGPRDTGSTTPAE